MSRIAIFLAGFGAGTAVALFSGLSPDILMSRPDASDTNASTPRGATQRGRETAELQKTLTEEKQKLAMMAADLAQLQKDLAEARKSEPNLFGHPENTATSIQIPATPVATLTPAQKAEKIAALKGMISGLVEKKDGTGLVKLIHELRAMGVEGYAPIMEIAGILDKDMWGQGGREFNLKMQDYYTAFPPEIHAWALDAANVGNVPPEFLVHAAHGIMWSPNPDKDRLVLEAILRESDPETIENMTEVLTHRPDEATGSRLVDRLQNDTTLNDVAFTALLRTAARMPGQSVDNYLEGALATTSEGPRRDMILSSITRRNPPASGFMVDRVFPDSQASTLGIKTGDIIVSYGGIGLEGSSIAKIKTQVKGEGPYPVTILRNGSLVTLNVAPGQIGIDGTTVTKKE